jgi:hypothetical protein
MGIRAFFPLTHGQNLFFLVAILGQWYILNEITRQRITSKVYDLEHIKKRKKREEKNKNKNYEKCSVSIVQKLWC